MYCSTTKDLWYSALSILNARGPVAEKLVYNIIHKCACNLCKRVDDVYANRFVSVVIAAGQVSVVRMPEGVLCLCVCV